LNRTVVKVTDVTDPIVADPVRIVNTDYHRGELIFTLNHSVPTLWVNAVRSVGGPYTMSTQPGMLRVSGKTAHIPTGGGGDEAGVKRLVEQWIEQANRTYAEQLKAIAANQEREERRRLEAERQEEEYRAKVLKQVNS